MRLRPLLLAIVLAAEMPGLTHAEEEKAQDVTCEGRWSLKVKVTGGRRHCRKGKSYATVVDVLLADGRYVSRMRPSMERAYALEAVPQGRTCTRKWHDELITTVVPFS
jgi:hypothetical protein